MTSIYKTAYPYYRDKHKISITQGLWILDSKYITQIKNDANFSDKNTSMPTYCAYYYKNYI